MELRIPASTLFKVLAAVALAALAIRLAPLLLLVFLATLVAVTLAPVFRWIERHAPRWVAVSALALGLAAGLTLFLAFVLPAIIDQLSTVAKNMPQYRDALLKQIPPDSFLRKPIEQYAHGRQGPTSSQWIEKLLLAGQYVAGAIFQFLLLLVTSVYLVVDGPRVFGWFLAFFAPVTRRKLRRTADEVSEVIFAYVAGQAITSALVFACTLIVLKALRVPAPMALAVFAGVFDVLPVLGFFLSAIPAALMALTVSPTTALIVAGYCVAYHAVENYVVVPRVYGNRLRLSTLAVLLSLLAADLVAGVAGAIAVLPIVASFPIIERLWLVPWIGSDAVERHMAQDQAIKKEAS